MSFWIAGSMLVSAAGAAYASNKSSKAAAAASNAQQAAADKGIDATLTAQRESIAAQKEMSSAAMAQQQAQYEAFQKLLSPFVASGTSALGAQQDLLGLNGTGAQGAAIGAIENSPQFAALAQQGESGILANASATGGLRGGNLQGALAQFRPQLLSQLIEQQYSRLGGLTSLGQNAAAGVGNAGVATGQSIASNLLGTGSGIAQALQAGGANVANLYQQQGAAQAGGGLAQAKINADLISSLTKTIGQGAAMYGGF